MYILRKTYPEVVIEEVTDKETIISILNKWNYTSLPATTVEMLYDILITNPKLILAENRYMVNNNTSKCKHLSSTNPENMIKKLKRFKSDFYFITSCGVKNNEIFISFDGIECNPLLVKDKVALRKLYITELLKSI